MSREEPKKLYSFRFDKHTNTQLTRLASKFHKDRTEILVYLISVYSAMWLDGETPDFSEVNGDE